MVTTNCKEYEVAKREIKPLNVNPEPEPEVEPEEATGAQLLPAPKVDESALNYILGDGREVADYSEDGDPFLPYKRGFDADVIVDGLEIKKNYDSAGVFLYLKTEAVADHRGQQEPDPQDPPTKRVEVNTDYVQGWFTQHKTIPDFVTKTHRRAMREFAAEVSGNDPNDKRFDDTVPLRKLHERTMKGEKLGMKFRVSSNFVRRTKNGKALYHMTWSYLQGDPGTEADDE